MSKLYCLPGMGTDERVFQHLVPLLPPRFEVQYLTHQAPVDHAESIAAYAARLAKALPPNNPAPIFMGVSLGGPIAVELAKFFPKPKLVLISTYKQRLERPPLFKLTAYLPLHRLISYRYTCNWVPRLARWSRICSVEDSHLLADMFKENTAEHFAWARHALVHWDNPTPPQDCLHLNGDADHIFRTANPHADYLIAGGTHNMILDRAETLAPLIIDYLNKA